ncbi:hypothetical protein CAEBREN_24155 [Caenorhabditis brenneri]|uniref:Uncharacterized protein n=1 Tax=Caenorhabditis brenneri TaxID=135651 RepID=G0NGN3_CAEBE|nr:hypothetical protein CAEBREN_24155 [Caenorhabditis brenneri]
MTLMMICCKSERKKKNQLSSQPSRTVLLNFQGLQYTGFEAKIAPLQEKLDEMRNRENEMSEFQEPIIKPTITKSPAQLQGLQYTWIEVNDQDPVMKAANRVCSNTSGCKQLGFGYSCTNNSRKIAI